MTKPKSKKLPSVAKSKPSVKVTARSSSADLLSIIGENYPNGSISLIDKDLNFIYTNGSGYKLFGINPSIFKGKPLDGTIRPEVVKIIKKNLPRILEGESITHEIEIDGVHFLNSYRPVWSKSGKINSFVLTSQDITDFRNIEIEHDKLSSVVQRSLNEIYIYNPDTLLFEYVNESALSNLGYTLEEMRKMSSVDIKPEFTPEQFNELLDELRTGKKDKIVLETIHKRSNDTTYPVEVHLQLIKTKSRQVFASIGIDISQRKTAEKDIQEKNEELATVVEELNASSEELLEQNEKLQALLKEKESLFKELHHRIKNNLQIVSSLLYLKSRTKITPEVEAFIKETKSKIISISLLHEQLLQLQGIDRLDIRGYLLALTDNIINSYATNKEAFPLKMNVDSFELAIDQVLNIGMLVNEVMSNSVKYAYPNQSGGPLHLNFSVMNNTAHLQIGDEGVGFAEKSVNGTRKSYGMQLITLFAEQLKADLQIENHTGTTFNITFKL